MSPSEEIVYYVWIVYIQISCVCWYRLTKVGAYVGYAHKYLLLKIEKINDQASARTSGVQSAWGQNMFMKAAG